MKKASNIEAEKRVFTIQGWIIDGVQDYLIIKQATTHWNISSRQAKRYLKTAYENWKSDGEISIEMKRASRIADIKQDIRTLDEKFKKTPQGLKYILDAKKELNKLEDLYPAKKIQLSGDVENPIQHKVEISIVDVGICIVNSEEEVNV